MYISDKWQDYRVLDAGDGEKLEVWKDVVLRRPDPQVIWPRQNPDIWSRADAHYIRSARGGGEWKFMRSISDKWVVRYGDMAFYVRPTGFKHTGLFPEQAVNWDWMREITPSGKRLKVLNLFGYTGGATIACCKAGSTVTHVDAAKGMVQWAGENRTLNNLSEESTRWIIDDAGKFVAREKRRGSFYDGIIMDPPSYGRGPGGEIWKLEDELYPLIEACCGILSENARFMLVNSYTTGLQPAVLYDMMYMALVKRLGGNVDSGEVALPIESGGVLPCGASGRWVNA